MTEEYRKAAQEHQEASAALEAESEKYVANLSNETMTLPESFMNAVQREREAFEKLQDLTIIG